MRPKILIVDDYPLNVEILVAYLNKDFELASAYSGKDAIEKVVSFSPALVLLDVMMPGMNGYDVCRELRRMPECADTPVIMVTAKAMPAECSEGIAAGANDYLTKPFRKAELLKRINALLQ